MSNDELKQSRAGDGKTSIISAGAEEGIKAFKKADFLQQVKISRMADYVLGPISNAVANLKNLAELSGAGEDGRKLYAAAQALEKDFNIYSLAIDKARTPAVRERISDEVQREAFPGRY